MEFVFLHPCGISITNFVRPPAFVTHSLRLKSNYNLIKTIKNHCFVERLSTHAGPSSLNDSPAWAETHMNKNNCLIVLIQFVF
jgi:hypothetical protein